MMKKTKKPKGGNYPRRKGYYGMRKAKKYLEARGYMAEIWPHGKNKDLFGFADIIAVNKWQHHVYIQVKYGVTKPSKKTFEEFNRNVNITIIHPENCYFWWFKPRVKIPEKRQAFFN